MKKVTDPEILKLLNAPLPNDVEQNNIGLPPGVAPHEVFLAKELEKQRGGGYSGGDLGKFKAAQPILNSILGTGEGIGNSLSNAGNFIQGKPQGAPFNVAPEGLPKEVGNIAGSVLTQILLARLGMGAGVPSTLATRLGGMGLYGASQNPSNKLEGAVEGIGGQFLLGETPKLSGKVLKMAGELFHPAEAAAKGAQRSRDELKAAKEFQTEEYFGPSVNKYAEHKIDPEYSSAIMKILSHPEQKNSYGVAVKDAMNQFRKSPTIKNAQTLDQEFGRAVRRYPGVGGGLAHDEFIASQKGQDIIRKAIVENLNSVESGAGDLYMEGLKHHKKVVQPFNDLGLHDTNIPGVAEPSPAEWEHSLSNLAKRKAFDQDHMLAKELENISNLNSRGRFLGLGWAGNKLAKITQEPWIQKNAPKMEAMYRELISNPGLAYLLSENSLLRE